MTSCTPAATGGHSPTGQGSNRPEDIQPSDLEAGRPDVASVVGDGGQEEPPPPSFFTLGRSDRGISGIGKAYMTLAAQKNKNASWRETRRFGTLDQLLLVLLQQWMTAGEDDLLRLLSRRAEAKAASSPDSDEIGRELDEKTHTLADRLANWRIQHSELVKLDIKFRKFPRVRISQLRYSYKFQKDKLGFSKEDLKYLRYAYDTVTTTANPEERAAKWLMEPYGPRWTRFVQNGVKWLLRWIFRQSDSNREYTFNSEGFYSSWPWGKMVLFYIMVIPPTLVMYLVALSKTNRAIFSSLYFVFLTTLVSLLPVSEFGLPLACLLGFMALLGNFLAQGQAATDMCAR